MRNMKDIWNEIRFKLRRCADNNESEKVYEGEFANCLGQLGWSEWKGEIVRQYPVKAGHETKLADIVLKKDDVEQVVVEMKRPSHPFGGKDELQIFSYMRLLPHQVRFGISVGSDIRVYYDDPETDNKPELVKVIELKEDNEDGIELLRHFCKETFSFEDFQGYCLTALKERNERVNLKKEIAQLTSEEWQEKIIEYIGRELIEKGYEGRTVAKALETVHVAISVEQAESPTIQTASYISQRQSYSSHKGQDYTQYKFEGITYGKGRLVQAVIKHFVMQSPNTYVEWLNFFSGANACSQPIIEKLSEMVGDRINRYFMKPNDVLTSTDGTKFVVCSQWGIHNIDGFLRWAQKKGLKIETLK